MTAPISRLRLPAAVILLTILADQWVKQWMLYGLGMVTGRVYELTPFFNLVMVWNQGVSFGFLSGGTELTRWLLTAMGLAISTGLGIWLWRVSDRWLQIALALVIGGALGNIIDRLRYGAVADFFDVYFAGYHWPAFNIADSAICIGVAMLFYDSIIREPRKKRENRDL